MVTLMAEYALGTATYLAEHHGSPRTARQTAQCTGGPINHRSDVFNERGKAGLVQSRRG
jgi:DNA-binding IscR family transcriptional regulator